VNGLSSCSACRPSFASFDDNCILSEAHERARKMNLNICIALIAIQQKSVKFTDVTYWSNERNPFQAILQYNEDILVCSHEIGEAPDIPPVRVDLETN
jgi:hypothetical protein